MQELTTSTSSMIGLQEVSHLASNANVFQLIDLMVHFPPVIVGHITHKCSSRGLLVWFTWFLQDIVDVHAM